MINRKFLNFKTYNGFLARKNEISEDSIVFIQDQDKPCIWARGKEYICDGPSTASVERNTLTFKNGNDKMIFKFQQKDGTITIEDSEGNKSSATYILENVFNQSVNNIYDAIENIQEISSGYVLQGELAKVALTGSYTDLENAPSPITVDTQLDSESENPVQNKAIYSRLQNKVDYNSLNNYVTSTKHSEDLDKKQETLFADYGINIFRDTDQKLKIRTTLDTSVYVIVESLESITNPDPNKIYLLETQNQDETYVYNQYRFRNGQWVSIDTVMPTIDLSLYELKNDANTEHQLIWNAIRGIDLTPYAKREDDIDPILANFNKYALKTYVDNNFQIAGDYATKNWVKTYFVQKEQVYSPRQGEWGQDGPSNEEPQVDPSIITSAINDLQNNKVDKSSMVTLTVQAYENLVSLNMVDENTYYFTYEPEEEPETPTEGSWHFGDEFPIILTDNWAFGGTFPITLT